MSSQPTASFRDPENAAFQHDGTWYRIASPASAAAIDTLRDSELYSALIDENAIVPIDRVDGEQADHVLASFARTAGREPKPGSRVFRVNTVEVITYPWEWPNSLLESAAQLTLSLRMRLLDIGLDLKDASAFNVQFDGLSPASSTSDPSRPGDPIHRGMPRASSSSTSSIRLQSAPAITSLRPMRGSSPGIAVFDRMLLVSFFPRESVAACHSCCCRRQLDRRPRRRARLDSQARRTRIAILRSRPLRG